MDCNLLTEREITCQKNVRATFLSIYNIIFYLYRFDVESSSSGTDVDNKKHVCQQRIFKEIYTLGKYRRFRHPMTFCFSCLCEKIV